MPASETNTTTAVHVPTVLWAQRDDKVFLTIAVEDIDKPEIKIEENTLHFSGTANKTKYELNVEFYKAINKPESKYGIYGQKHWMFILKKQERGPYWPRLLKDTKKVHWLKADWNKWKDEDDEEEEDAGQGNDFDNMFKQMGGLGGLGGAGGFGGPGFGGPGFGADDMPNLDDLDDKPDSDDEKLPDLEENKEDKSEEKSATTTTTA